MFCSDIYLVNVNSVTFQAGWNRKLSGPLNFEDSIKIGHTYALGGAAAYSRKLLAQFAPMHNLVFQEDNILTFRALLLGGISIAPEQLVGYRQHNNIYAAKTVTVQTPSKGFAIFIVL